MILLRARIVQSVTHNEQLKMNQYVIQNIGEFSSDESELEFYRKTLNRLIWFVEDSTDLSRETIKDYLNNHNGKRNAHTYWKEKIREIFHPNNEDLFKNCHELYLKVYHEDYADVADFFYREGFGGCYIPFTVFKEYLREDTFECFCDQPECPRQIQLQNMFKAYLGSNTKPNLEGNPNIHIIFTL